MEKQTREPIFHKHNLKIKNGEICCEGCYRIGIKEGRTQAISKFKEKLKKKFNICRDKTDVWADEERWNKFEKMFKAEIKKTAQEIKISEVVKSD